MMNPKDYKHLGEHTIAAHPRRLPALFLSTRFVEKKYYLDSLIFQWFLVSLQVNFWIK